jgi:hypothetical protein
LASRLKEINDTIKALTVEKASLETELQSNLSHPRCKIGDVKVQKVNRLGNIDYQSIEVLKTIDLEKYRKPMISYWKFSF